MTQHRDRRRLLSPVLADEPLVGESLTRRLRIVLVSVAVAFFLTNVTSYFLGQAFLADARERATADANRRVAELERKFSEDLAARKEARDQENAAQNAEVQQLRRDLCVALDRVQPRDGAVVDARKRYGCKSTPTQAPADGAQANGMSSTGPGGGSGQDEPEAPAGGRGPAGSAGPPGPPGPPASNPPPSEPDDGLVCLPLLGCVL